jgi:hypothetical protein
MLSRLGHGPKVLFEKGGARTSEFRRVARTRKQYAGHLGKNGSPAGASRGKRPADRERRKQSPTR